MRWAIACLWIATASCKSSEATSLDGRDLFAANCARCHGANGAGGVPITDGGPAPRNLRDPAFQRSMTDRQLHDVVMAGKPPGMPAFDKTLSGPEVDKILAYVRTLDSEKKP